MNLEDKKYSRFALVQEMMQTADTVSRFDPSCSTAAAEALKASRRMYMTG